MKSRNRFCLLTLLLLLMVQATMKSFALVLCFLRRELSYANPLSLGKGQSFLRPVFLPRRPLGSIPLAHHGFLSDAALD